LKKLYATIAAMIAPLVIILLKKNTFAAMVVRAFTRYCLTINFAAIIITMSIPAQPGHTLISGLII
jgi:hypothetical protein